MKKEDILKVLEEQPDADFVVRTADEDKTFLENYAAEYKERVIAPEVKNIYNKIDEDIYSVTGIKKPVTEKTYDFLKRVLKEKDEKAKAVDDLLNEKRELEKQIADGSTDKKVIADLEKVREEYNRLKEESEQKINSVQGEYQQFKIRSEITSALSGMQFNDKIPEAAMQALVNSTINDLVSHAEYREGQLFFIDQEGNPMRNKNNALNPYTAKELLAERLKDVIKEKKASGPKVSDEISKEHDASGKVTKIALVVPDSIKTRVELGDFLVSKGIKRGTPDYYLAYKDYGANLPVK